MLLAFGPVSFLLELGELNRNGLLGNAALAISLFLKKLFIFKIHFYFYLAWVFATAHVG